MLEPFDIHTNAVSPDDAQALLEAFKGRGVCKLREFAHLRDVEVGVHAARWEGDTIVFTCTLLSHHDVLAST
jgi:hypothetical protein